MFALEAAGVVDGEGGTGGRRHGEGDVVLVEGFGLPAPVEADEPEDRAAQGEGHDDQGVRAALRDGVRRVRVGVQPGCVGGQRDEAGAQVGGGEREGGTEGEAAGDACGARAVFPGVGGEVGVRLGLGLVARRVAPAARGAA